MALIASIPFVLLSAAAAQATSGAWERAWGVDVSQSGGTGFETCTAAADCKVGEFTGANGSSFSPGDAATGADGSVYVTDENRIVKFDPSGNFVLMWGKDVDGFNAGTGAETCSVAAHCKTAPSGGRGGELWGTAFLAIDSVGNVYVTEENRRVQEFDSGGHFIRAWGKDVVEANGETGFEVCTVAASCQAGGLGSLGGEFQFAPDGITVDSDGNVFVVDGGNNRVEKFDSSGNFLQAWGKNVDGSNAGTGFEVCDDPAHCKEGEEGGLGGEFSSVFGIGAGPGNIIYVADYHGHRIEKFNSSGNFLLAWGKDVDGTNLDTGFETCSTAASCKAGESAGRGGELSFPLDVAADAAGNVYVSEPNNRRIHKFDSSGHFLRVWGKNVDSGGGDGAEVCTVADLCKAGDPGGRGGEFSSVGGLGNGPGGLLYAAGNVRIDKFGNAAATDPPAVTGVTPASPAKDNSPKVFGSGPDAGATISLYTNAACTGAAVATGTQTEFSSTGIAVTVADNSTTTFYARATVVGSAASSCSSSSVTYVEDSTPPPAPTITASSPSSPADQNSPKIKGTAEAGSTVRLYTNSSCTGAPAGSGSSSDFASPGLSVFVADDTTTTFYATATDTLENVSSCSSSGLTYKERSTPVIETPPTITGNPNPGQTLTAEHGTWANSPTEYALSWLRCDQDGANCSTVAGATESTYELTDDDLYSRIRVRVVATNGVGPSQPADSSATAAVAPPGVPANTDRPMLSPPSVLFAPGPESGDLVTGSAGTWTGAPTQFKYQWRRCQGPCTDIAGATASTYRLAPADAGYRVRLRVVATNASGPSAPADSELTQVVRPVAVPTNTGAPSITGAGSDPRDGMTLTAHHGAWTGSPTSYEYQWLRCGPSGSLGSCSVIGGADGATYVISPTDRQGTIRLRVVASNAGGPSAPADSAATPEIGTRSLVADFTFGPNPSCVGVRTRLDATASAGPHPIVRWEFSVPPFFDTTRRTGEPSRGPTAVAEFGDGSSPLAAVTFGWNQPFYSSYLQGKIDGEQVFIGQGDPVYWGAGLWPGPVVSDPRAEFLYGQVRLTLKVTDSTGATATTGKLIPLAQGRSDQPASGCPSPVAGALKPAVPVSGVALTGQSVNASVACDSPLPCDGDLHVEFLGAAVSAAAKGKRSLARATFRVAPHHKKRIHARLTKRGKRLVKRHHKLRVRIVTTVVNARGKRITRKKTARLKLHGKAAR